ncbi:lasso peptide biosynthesis B2 protein [Streptomonospora sp. S1-112]|uniref:Lasso peptide biosynthesis B2 protein n=1 Tax=Streptomonospora mangrovi TaxID=2883123 RepID=A0A9X3NTX2_9ACTN|nr:lasso peptide biosynthesis B2 protein [Streptomonospora mangrovi]
MDAYVTAPEHLRSVAFPAVTVLLDTRTGTVQALTGTAAKIWAEIATTADPQAPVAGIAPETVARTVSALAQRRLLLSTATAQPWSPPAIGHEPSPSWGTHVSPAALTAIPAPPWPWHLPAAAALIATLITRHAGRRQRRFARLQRLATRQTPLRPAPPATVRHAVRAVRRVSRLIPARVACLEESTAAMVTLRALGYSAQWRHGVATDPIRLHAWVQAGGRPVDEPADTANYTPFPGAFHERPDPAGSLG